MLALSILAELLEEGLEHGLPVPLRAPDHAVGVVVEHDRHVLVALLVRSLVDADADQAVEAVPGLGVELVVDAPAYAADARPVDAHELGRGGLGGPACEPGDLLLELAREAGGVLGPGHGCDDDPCSGHSTLTVAYSTKAITGPWSIVLHLLGDGEQS